MTIDKSAYGVVIGFGGMGLCLVIVALAQLFGKFRHVMPDVREWLLWLMAPQFGMGMVFAFGLTTACLFLLAWRRP